MLASAGACPHAAGVTPPATSQARRPGFGSQGSATVPLPCRPRGGTKPRSRRWTAECRTDRSDGPDLKLMRPAVMTDCETKRWPAADDRRAAPGERQRVPVRRAAHRARAATANAGSPEAVGSGDRPNPDPNGPAPQDPTKTSPAMTSRAVTSRAVTSPATTAAATTNAAPASPAATDPASSGPAAPSGDRLHAAVLIAIAVVALSAIAAVGWLQYQSDASLQHSQHEISVFDLSVRTLADTSGG